MLSILKERNENKRKAEHEKRLKKELAQKCADMENQYVSHEEDETQYTILTINGETITVKKEEITIESITDFKQKNRKSQP
jgi:chloramphenicol O-acetyltransferase